jgi:hypothetical protein
MEALRMRFQALGEAGPRLPKGEQSLHYQFAI